MDEDEKDLWRHY